MKVSYPICDLIILFNVLWIFRLLNSLIFFVSVEKFVAFNGFTDYLQCERRRKRLFYLYIIICFPLQQMTV